MSRFWSQSRRLTSPEGRVGEYVIYLYRYFRRRGYGWFAKFESLKDVLVNGLYKRRGKYSRPLLHFGTIGVIFGVILLGPIVFQADRSENPVESLNGGIISAAQVYGSDLSTVESEDVRQFRGGEVTIHRVQSGETISSIAALYNLEIETILWENNLEKTAKLKPDQELRILPIDGVRHRVQRGETIYSLAKKYGLGDDQVDAQRIVNYPFNEFKNSETFELAIGQTLLIPDGVKPNTPSLPRSSFASQLTPDAGTVTAAGSFVWPAQGRITQRYSFYHKAYDIANRSGGAIVAADGGTVTVAGWIDNSGYGNRVLIDHGNGYVTLYAHLSLIQVKPGQRVAAGNVIGQMGSTGRSTGTHLHFEIRRGGVLEDPGKYLR